MKRDIITIDEDKCTGCGICITGCHEGALQLIDGKARLVNEIFCDGLGACIADCPEDAIRIEHKEASAYNETETMKTLLEKSDATVIAHLEHLHNHNAMDFYKEGVEYLKEQKRFDILTELGKVLDAPKKIEMPTAPSGCGCSSSEEKEFKPQHLAAPTINNISTQSELTHWPVQLHLVSISAPFFKNPELVIMSTCGPIASPTVHQDYIRGRSVIVACPKLDRTEPYREKLAGIFENGGIRKVLVVRMEVPCCSGLTKIIQDARGMSGKSDIIIEEHTLSLQGELISMNRK
ncbi:MAG: 4Fe-4S ferredoxin [Bacteroidetes bacterium 4572_77]|nr:MAG: 4Fe-4S ferredoxin [Bacteroidetes bacterium 4572_77]